MLQKAVKDRVPINSCNLEYVLWYHIECPEYAKKFDDPNLQRHLKRQIFNLLTVPYMSMRMTEMNIKKNKITPVIDLEKKEKYIEYPEEIKLTPKLPTQKLEEILKDRNLREKFFQGVEYQKDPTNDEWLI